MARFLNVRRVRLQVSAGTDIVQDGPGGERLWRERRQDGVRHVEDQQPTNDRKVSLLHHTGRLL